MSLSGGSALAIGSAFTWLLLTAQTRLQVPQQVDPKPTTAALAAGDIVVVGQPDQIVSEWVRAESANFEVYGQSPAKVAEVADKLERFRQLLHHITGVKPQQALSPLPVYLMRGNSQLERLRRQPSVPNMIYTGYYSAAPTGVVLAAEITLDINRNVLPTYYETWLYTEYARHFLSQHAGDLGVPVWYVDGLALYLSTVQFAGDRIEYGPAHPSLVQWLAVERWEPIENILSGEVRSGQIYSAQSMLLVHYIFSSPANGARFAQFLFAVKGGADPVATFERLFATDMSTLKDELWTYSSRLPEGRALTLARPDPQIGVLNLPQSANALLLDRAAMLIGVPELDRQQSILRRIRSTHARNSDRYSRRALVEAEILYGTPRSIDPMLGAMLVAAPDDPDLLYLKGLRHLLAGRQAPSVAHTEFREARKWFGRAYRRDPDHYQSLYRYAESLSAEPTFVSENTVNILHKASLLVPQATQIRISTALMLMANSHFDKSDRILSDIVVNRRDPASLQVPRLREQARLKQPPSAENLIASFRYTATWRDLNCC